MLNVRIKPRAAQQIDKAAAAWAENRPAAPGAIRNDLRATLDALIEQPGIGTKVENSRNQDARCNLTRIRYLMYDRVKGTYLEVVAFWHKNRGRIPNV